MIGKGFAGEGRGEGCNASVPCRCRADVVNARRGEESDDLVGMGIGVITAGKDAKSPLAAQCSTSGQSLGGKQGSRGSNWQAKRLGVCVLKEHAWINVVGSGAGRSEGAIAAAGGGERRGTAGEFGAEWAGPGKGATCLPCPTAAHGTSRPVRLPMQPVQPDQAQHAAASAHQALDRGSNIQKVATPFSTVSGLQASLRHRVGGRLRGIDGRLQPATSVRMHACARAQPSSSSNRWFEGCGASVRTICRRTCTGRSRWGRRCTTGCGSAGPTWRHSRAGNPVGHGWSGAVKISAKSHCSRRRQHCCWVCEGSTSARDGSQGSAGRHQNQESTSPGRRQRQGKRHSHQRC